MSVDDPHPKAAYLKFVFLPPSEVQIAGQIKALSRYDPVVLAVSTPDLMGLPPKAVHALAGLNPVSRLYNRARFKLGLGCPYFERVLRQESCQLIHAHFGPMGVYGTQLKARTGLPLVTTFHGYDATGLPRRRPKTYQRLFAEGDLFLACSEALRKQLLSLGCPEDRLRVLHIGIDLDQIPFREREPGPDGTVNILMVGRLVEKKGLPYALRAFNSVRLHHRQATLTIIGEGPERKAVETLRRELNLSEVRLLGAQPHDVVLSEMERAHIFLQPSVTAANGDTEGIPATLMEAQAAGLPVVSTWHAGIPELVVDGQSGYLASERNAHALAEYLRHLIEHPELWGPMGRAGRAIVEERFNRRRQSAILESYYDELVDGASS